MSGARARRDVAGSRRRRRRAETVEEIRALALEQVDAEGAASLSLNAIARTMGVSGPAIYRYFASRDALLGDLVEQGYGELGEELHRAAEAGADPSAADRLAAIARAYRAWALAHPNRYALLFEAADRPVASGEAIARIGVGMRALLQVLAGGSASGEHGSADPALESQVGDWARARDMPAASHSVLRLGVLTWSRLHGIVSLELAGAFAEMNVDAGLLVDAEVAEVARAAGL